MRLASCAPRMNKTVTGKRNRHGSETEREKYFAAAESRMTLRGPMSSAPLSAASSLKTPPLRCAEFVMLEPIQVLMYTRSFGKEEPPAALPEAADRCGRPREHSGLQSTPSQRNSAGATIGNRGFGG